MPRGIRRPKEYDRRVRALMVQADDGYASEEREVAEHQDVTEHHEPAGQRATGEPATGTDEHAGGSQEGPRVSVPIM